MFQVLSSSASSALTYESRIISSTTFRFDCWVRCIAKATIPAMQKTIVQMIIQMVKDLMCC